MKQYDVHSASSGGSLSLEERMLEAITKKVFSFSYGVSHGKGLAAKSCAEIAQEEIDKAVKERCIEFGEWLNKKYYTGEMVYEDMWQKWDGGRMNEAGTTEQLFEIFITK